MKKLLDIKDLTLSFSNSRTIMPVVHKLSLEVQSGEIVGLVGESGCGKSVTAQTIMGLSAAQLEGGSIYFEGEDLLSLPPSLQRKIRGEKMAMIFQDPMSSLNPCMKIGAQIMEGLRYHHRLTRLQAKQAAIELLKTVEIDDAELRFHQYPHQLSGGMRQRVMIAIAIACHPKLLIADEPTTALDSTIQAHILKLLTSLQKELHMGLLFITHNLAIVADICDRIYVMHEGSIVESGFVKNIYSNPSSPYTKSLLDAIAPLYHNQLKTYPLQVTDLLEKHEAFY